MALLEKVNVNLDQRSTWPRINSEGDRHMFMDRLLNCFAILGKTSTRSIEIVVSDQYLSRKFGGWDPVLQAYWAATRWTVEEKREWVEKVKLSIQDRQSLVSKEGH